MTSPSDRDDSAAEPRAASRIHGRQVARARASAWRRRAAALRRAWSERRTRQLGRLRAAFPAMRGGLLGLLPAPWRELCRLFASDARHRRRSTRFWRRRALHAEGLEPRQMLAANLLADLNGDGWLDGGDVDFLSIAVRDGVSLRALDLNRDAQLDAADVEFFLHESLRTRAGDLDLDGSVSGGDMLHWMRNFGSRDAVWSQGDLNSDGVVGVADFSLISGSLGYRSSAVRYLRLVADSAVDEFAGAAIGELDVLDASGAEIDKQRWRVFSVSSETLGDEPAPAHFAIDGDPQTYWQTEPVSEDDDSAAPHPHQLVIDLGGYFDVDGVVYTPRQDRGDGRIAEFRLYQGRSADQWGEPLAQGELLGTEKRQIIRASGVEIANTRPELAELPDQRLAFDDEPLHLELSGFDADGDALSYVAVATVANPLFDIRTAYGLRFDGDYFENLTGLNEKWLSGAFGTSYFLLPDGDLLQWQGTFEDTAARESLVVRLDSTVYEDPSLLWNAAPEAPAPAVVTVEGNQLIVDPVGEVFGEMQIDVWVTDGEESATRRFALRIDENPTEAWASQIAALRQAAESLEYDQIPAFLAQLSELEANMTGRPAAEAGDLARTLAAIYEQGEARIGAANEWAAREEELLRSRLATVERIERELGVLQAEYDAAWTAIAERMDQDSAASETGPPIFVLGTDVGPFEIGVGETLELDLSAIHPTHVVYYSFDEGVDVAGLGALAYHPQSGIFRWSVPSHAQGRHEFTVVAEVAADNQAKITFEVNVVSNNPTIASLSASPSTITDRGADLVTLTARGVEHPTGQVGLVEFWFDADHDGALDPDRYGPPRNDQEFYGELIRGKDRLLGVDRDGSDGWSWTGALPDLEAGSQVVFARSKKSTQAAELYSAPVEVAINVLETPSFDLFEEIGGVEQVETAYNFVGEPTINEIVLPQFDASLGTLTRAEVTVTAEWGHTDAAYGAIQADHAIEFEVGPFSFSGVALGLPGVPGYGNHNHALVVIAPDTRRFHGEGLQDFSAGPQRWAASGLKTGYNFGHRHNLTQVVFRSYVAFECTPWELTPSYGERAAVNVHLVGGDLFAEWYEDGQTVQRVHLDSDVQTYSGSKWVSFAVDHNGNVAAAYHKGEYYDEDVFMVAASRDGTIQHGPALLHSRTSGVYKHPSLAMNSQGQGVVVWNDQDWSEFDAGRRATQTVAAMRTFEFHSSGVQLGPEVEFSAPDGSADYPTAAAVSEAGDYLIGWQGGYARNRIAEPDEHVAHASGNVRRNDLVAMHASGWTVTLAEGRTWDGFGSYKLQALDPQGIAVGQPFDLGDRRPIRLEMDDSGELAVWLERPSSTALDRQTLKIDLQTDLAPQSLAIVDPRSLAAGQPFEVEFTVRNEGLLETDPFDVLFSLSRDATPSDGDRLLGTATVDAVVGESLSAVLRATLSMPDNADPFWNEGTTDLHLIMSIPGGGGLETTPIAFVATERTDDGPGDGGDEGGDDGNGGGSPPPADSGAPYIRPEIALDQLGSNPIKATYDTTELIARQMVAALRVFANEARGVRAWDLYYEIEGKIDRIELALETHYEQKWEMFQAREEAKREAREKRDEAKVAAESRRIAEEEEEQQRRQAVIDDAVAKNEDAKRDRDARIEAAEAERDAEVAAWTREYNDAIDRYNGILNRGADAFESALKTIWGYVRDPLKAFRDALGAAEDAIDYAEAKIDAAKQKYLDVRAGILKEYDFIFDPLQEQIDKLPTLEEIKNRALATRENAYEEAEQRYDAAVAWIDEEFGDDLDRLEKNAAPVLKNPGLQAVVEVIRNPGGAKAEIVEQLASLPDANPVGNPAEIFDSVTEVVEAITEGRLDDVIAKILPPEAVQAAGDLAEWGQDAWGKSWDWMEEKGELVADWLVEGREKAQDWVGEQVEDIKQAPWYPFKPRPQVGMTMIDWLKLDHGYNTHQATIVYQLAFAPNRGLTGEYLAEFESQFLLAVERLYRVWLSHPKRESGKLSTNDIFTGAQDLAMRWFLAKYELNPDGSPSVTYIDDDTTWAEYYEEHKDDPPPRREGWRKPQWVADVQGLFLTEEETGCDGCEVDESGMLFDPDGSAVGWVDLYLVGAIAEETGNPNPVWGSDGTAIVDQETGEVVGSFYIPENDQPSTYHDFHEPIAIGGTPEDPISVPPPPGPGNDDGSADDAPDPRENWGPPTNDRAKHRQRVEISEKLFPSLRSNAVGHSDQLIGTPNLPVRDFYERLDAAVGYGLSYVEGFGRGVSKTAEGLAAAAGALVTKEAWSNLADQIATSGRLLGHDFTQFLNAADRAEFVKQYGSDWRDFINHSVETVAVGVLTQWYQASEEERPGIAGEITGMIVSEMLVEAAGAGVLKKLGRAAKGLGTSGGKIADDVLDSPQWKELDDNFAISKLPPLDQQLLLAGIDPQHARGLLEFAKAKGMTFVIRGANPNSLKYHKLDGYLPKPVDVKWNTRAETGLVEASRNADGKFVDAKGEVWDEYDVTEDGLIVGKDGPTGYRIGPGGVVEDMQGNKFYSDYDFMGAYENYDGTWINVSLGTGDAQDKLEDIGGSVLRDEINAKMGGPNMLQHGSNDEYWKNQGGVSTPGKRDVGDTFVIIDPEKGIMADAGLADLYQFNKDRGIPWYVEALEVLDELAD